jgi:ABC-2 type transport system ATP-binding protein
MLRPVAAVDVEGLTVRYGSLTAVNAISFTAAAGQVTSLLGPNGAGKSSTIETLEGYRAPDGGRVRVLGLDPVAEHRELVQRIGVMLQQGGVYPGIRAREAIELFCALTGGRRRADDLLEQVGLATRARSTWRQLSGGEQQRLSLALALAGSPEVIFLDEPTAGVDVAGRQLVRSIIRDLAATGVAVVLTTHELDEAERLSDHVVIIHHGSVVASGTPAELMSTDAGEVRFAAAPGLAVSGLAARVEAAVTETGPGEYLVAGAGTPTTVAAITAWLAEQNEPLGDLRVGRQRLEDVFLELTASSAPSPPARRGRRRR